MFSVLRRPYILGFISFNKLSHDVPKEVSSNSPQVDGWSRLTQMFKETEYESLSPQLITIMNTTLCGFFVGSFYGGVIQSRSAYHNFMDSNMATKFLNHYEAKRRIQDAVMLGFFKGAVKWGSRIAYFTGMYTFLYTTIGVYRGKSTILEYISAGFITGALYKISLGVRGIIAGGILGSILALITGSMSLLLLKLTGNTVEDHHAWMYAISESRSTTQIQEMKKQNQQDQEYFKNKTQSDIKDIDDEANKQESKNDDKKSVLIE